MNPNKESSVLVVDDNEMNVDLLASMLERFNYKVFTAYNGREALEAVAEHQPDLVLLDITMPEMSGYDACRAIKAREESAETPVIFISALDETNDVVKGFEVGGVDYIVKPFKSREVLVRVKTQLTLAQQKKQIEDMRRRERAQFEQVDRLRSQFIGSATHDLKNPLFVISGYADMLAMYPEVKNNPGAFKHVQSIHRSVDKMISLVHDMLDLMQLETAVTLDTEPIDFKAFVLNIVSDMNVAATDKKLKMSLDMPTDDVQIAMDEKRMTRVVENLVANAIKYTPSGGVIDIMVTTGDQSLILEVKDTGLGIPEDTLPHVFQPFQRVNTEEHMEQEGTGLGLSIVKTLVEQHGGTVEVESELGVGSRFRVTLPMR